MRSKKTIEKDVENRGMKALPIATFEVLLDIRELLIKQDALQKDGE